MKTLTLTAPWGGHAAGTVLEILGPGDPLGPRRVDPLRAESLLAQGLATDAAPADAPAEASAPPKRTKKKTGAAGGEG